MLWFQECNRKNQARYFAKLWQSGLLFLYFNNVNKTMLDIKKRTLKKKVIMVIIDSWLYMISVYAQI